MQLTADWWPSREVNSAASAASVASQSAIRGKLQALSDGAAVAETAGLWKLRAASAGHYRITLSPLPAEAAEAERSKLGKLKAGTVHIRSGKREVQMALSKGASSVTLNMDLAAGELDLETWFTGQLSDARILGAFFAEIERLGERKRPELELDLHPIPKK